MIERRNLMGGEIDGVRVLEAFVEADGTARVFFGAGTPPERVASVPGFEADRVVVVNKGLMVVGQGTPQRGALPVPLSGLSARVRAAEAEPEFFSGRRVLMGIRNGEPASAVSDWLRHHAAQGFDGALILDRCRPGEASLADLDVTVPVGMVRVVAVEAPLPLGGRAISERHPLAAPDAPGKDRMEAPAPDPWTAPMVELILLEALRWRFLADAAAVAFLDVFDLLLPATPGRSPLDLLVGAEPALVPLTGRRIYPWKITEGAEPGFGDHVCDLFDNESGNRRWVADPRRLPEDAPFRLVRIGGLTPDPMRSGFFLRAMAVRVTEAPEWPLAPKAGLVLEDELLEMARRSFQADPILPPVSQAALGANLPAALPGRTAIVTCMKNEGPFILEWLAHHRAIGVDDFLVYTNDCTDGTDTLLDLLQAHGILEHRENPFRDMPGVKPQHAALAAAEDEAILARAGWAICMDVDEFIDVHIGSGHLRDLYGAVGDANMISLTWRLFGNADQTTFEDRPTPARFERSAAQITRKPHQAWGFKTLFRNIGLYKKMGVHRPKGLKPDLWEDITWVNGSGRAMPKEMLRTGWRSTLETYGYDLVSLNHYAVRDAESFLVKRDRGRVNHVERDQGLGYWFRMNNNAEENTSFRRHLPGLEAELARLKALPGVAEQHAACVAAHRAKIAELRGAEAFAAFYAEITGARMARLSRMHQVFGANVFLAGPDCVPDEVAFGEHGPGFFFTVKDAGETAH